MAVYLEEIVPIDRGGKEAYLRLVAERLAPFLERTRDVRLVWLGSTVGSTARWPEAIALWELRGWGHWADVCGRMYDDGTDDRELAELWREASQLRLRPRSRTLVPAAYSPSLTQLLAEGVAGTVFAFARFRVRPGGMAAFLEALQSRAEAEERRGRALVGAWEVAFTNDEACALWAHATLDEISAWERERRPDDWKDVAERWSEHWGFAAPGTPLWPKGYRSDVPVW